MARAASPPSPRSAAPAAASSAPRDHAPLPSIPIPALTSTSQHHQPSENQTPRSRSPATRPLSSVQALLRSAPQTSHLSLSSPVLTDSPSGHHEPNQDPVARRDSSGNSLRQPVELVPADTPRLVKSSTPRPSTPPPASQPPSAMAPPGPPQAESPRTLLTRRRASAAPMVSSASFSGSEGLSRSQAFGSTVGSGRSHVRSGAKRPSTSGSAAASGVGSRSHSPVGGQTQSHHNSPTMGSREAFIGGEDQGRPVSPTRRGSQQGGFADFGAAVGPRDGDLLAAQLSSSVEAFGELDLRTDSPSSTAYLPSLPSPEPQADHGMPLVAREPRTAADREHEQLRRNIEQGFPGLSSSAIASADSLRRPSVTLGHSMRQRPASSSLPPGEMPSFEFRSSRSRARNAEGWDWKSFISAYADGRWDPWKTPTQPLSTPADESDAGSRSRTHSPSDSRATKRANSASAPSTSASVAPPKASTPPAGAYRLDAYAPAKNLQPIPPFSGGSPAPPTSLSGGASPRSSFQALPADKKKSMANEEFASLVRIAGANSDLSPFVLPSPEHEHVDPLRDYAHSPTRELPPSNLGSAARKAKASSLGPPQGTWTASSKGMLPSSGSVPPPSQSAASGNGLLGGLHAIPATPYSESGPNSSGSLTAPPIPMATAPLPVTESGRAAKNAASGDDYFGGPAQWQAATAAAVERERLAEARDPAADGVDPLDATSPRSAGERDGWVPHETVVSRRSSTWSLLSDTGSAGSSGSTRTILGRRASHVDGFAAEDTSPNASGLSTSVPSQLDSSSRRSISSVKPGALRFFPENALPKEQAATEAFRAFLSQPFTPADLTAPSSPPTQSQRPPLIAGRSDGSAPIPRIPLQSTKSDGIPRRLSGGAAQPAPPSAGSRGSSYQEKLFNEQGWLSAPKPPNELDRRRALYRFNILRSGQDVNFDRISHMAKLVFATRMVLISMVDDEDQWYKSESGLNVDCSPREPSLCAHVLLQNSPEPMIILDTHLDWRFKNNPLVLGPPHIRFYAGAPLRTPDGFNIGSLCVIDDKPRSEFSPRQRHVLKEFAAICMRELELFRDRLHLNRRAMIQDSMERFTKEVVEMDTTADPSLNATYQQAAGLIQKTLDVDGALIMDLSAFELIETTDDGGKTSFRFQADLYLEGEAGASTSRSSVDGDVTPGTDARPVNFLERQHSGRSIPSLPLLGASESLGAPKDRGRPLSGSEHQQIADWLKEHPNGRIYERVVPAWMRHMVPPGIVYAMAVPVFNIDGFPFALVCAYTCHSQKQFLEGFELKYLRAIGLIILSAVLKRRLTLADKAKSNFIANISHELRTPTHGALISGELLSDTKLDEQQTSYLQTMQACMTSLIETVNHVLDYTKLSGNTGRATAGVDEGAIQKSDVDLAQLIEETVEGCWVGQSARALLGDSEIGSVYAPPPSATPHAGRPQVECVIDIAGRDEGWRVQVEKGGIRRVLMNLVSNALKFTTDGYVLVALRALPCADDPDAVPIEIAVIDTGKGISNDFLQSQLFQPFSQENPLQTGTGLGLAIVNSIVSSDAVRGKVDVWSSEGLGTEIKVALNATPTRRRSSAAESLASVEVGQGLSVTFLGFDERVRGLKLLRDVLETNLLDWGFEPRSSDMPGWGDILMVNEGDAVIDHLADQGNVGRPVIIFTTSRSAVEQLRTVTAYREAGGFATIIYKPAGPTRILAALRACIQSLKGFQRRPSGSSRRSSNLSSSGSTTGTSSPHIVSDVDLGSPYSVHSSRSYSFEDDRTYFSGTPGASSSSPVAGGSPSGLGPGGALHPFSPQHLLQRRRSEEERDLVRRRPKRPSMGARSITFQPDQASPLSLDGYSAVVSQHPSSLSAGGAHQQHHPHQPPRKPSSEFDGGQPSTPSSPGSTISVIGGGVLLKSAVAPKAEVAGIRDAVVNQRASNVPMVLVVEDNVINRRVLSAFLRKKGFSYIETCDGQQGVDMFESKPPCFFDVILMDLTMPVLDGLSATRAIRAIEAARRSAHSRTLSLPSTPDPALRDQLRQRAKLLALTGLATAEDKKKAFASGVDGYLIKPVSLKTLDAVFKSFGYGL